MSKRVIGESHNDASEYENIKSKKIDLNSRRHESTIRRDCPYLGTINRHVLDFDFEKICSVSLATNNIYACLVCGKYYQGRGPNTYCNIHSLEEGHYLFINLKDSQVYCLPENYLVQDNSLNDIKYFLNPTYTLEDIEEANRLRYGKALDGTDYIPGLLGLNNLKKTDCFNVIIQMLCSVRPFRDKMLTFDTSKLSKPDLVIESLSELIRKIYNPNNFKGIVSPHEFLQSIGLTSKGKYKIGNQCDPMEFLQWLFVWIHSKLKRKGTNTSIVTDCFQGELYVVEHVGDEMESKKIPFKLLTLEIPQMSVFNDANAIGQIPIYDLFYKFDGNTPKEIEVGKFCTYSIWRLPKYMIIVIKRFCKNNFFLEKNLTIVTFPLKSLDMSSCIHPDAIGLNNQTKYNLIASITHVGQPEDGNYKIYVCHQPSGDWYEVEDLLVTPILAQLVTVSEAYIQIYQLIDE